MVSGKICNRTAWTVCDTLSYPQISLMYADRLVTSCGWVKCWHQSNSLLLEHPSRMAAQLILLRGDIVIFSSVEATKHAVPYHWLGHNKEPQYRRWRRPQTHAEPHSTIRRQRRRCVSRGTGMYSAWWMDPGVRVEAAGTKTTQPQRQHQHQHHCHCPSTLIDYIQCTL